jgi:phosphohistidine phosphatase SixA
VAVHLVRHADAGSRWADDDEHRPLSTKGKRQAKAVREALESVDLARLVSSRYTRCLQTLAPLGKRIGQKVEADPDLAEEADITASWNLVEHLAAEPGDSVVCSHGNVLGDILGRVRGRGAEIVASEWSCKKGSIWRLETDDTGEIVRAVLALRP